MPTIQRMRLRWPLMILLHWNNLNVRLHALMTDSPVRRRVRIWLSCRPPPKVRLRWQILPRLELNPQETRMRIPTIPVRLRKFNATGLRWLSPLPFELRIPTLMLELWLRINRVKRLWRHLQVSTTVQHAKLPLETSARWRVQPRQTQDSLILSQRKALAGLPVVALGN